jgi:hypothetical protein
MVYIQQSSGNITVLTLTEKCTLDDPEFLFMFENDETHNQYTFIAQDNSDFPLRYNRFTIVEKANPNTLNSEVRLPDVGMYHYTVYEQSSTTNLNVDNALGIVEIGKAKVYGEESENTAYTPSSSTNKAYTPQ